MDSGGILAVIGLMYSCRNKQLLVKLMQTAVVREQEGIGAGSEAVHPYQSAYQSTTMLEERHGFNKTTPGLFISDLLKTWALGFAIGGPFLAAFLYVCSNGPATVLFRGSWHSCEVSLSSLSSGGTKKRIKAGIPRVHGDSLPDRDPAAVQQALATAFGRPPFSHRGTG